MNLEEINKLSTMSSRELAIITGKEHFHILRDVDKLNQTYESIPLSKVGEGSYMLESTGLQQHREFHLTKMQIMDLLTGYSMLLRIKVLRRWEELEVKEAQLAVPQSFAQALQLAADQQLEIEKQAKALKEQEETLILQAPKVEFHDRVTENDATFDWIKAAGQLKLVRHDGKQLGRTLLIKFLNDAGVLHGDNLPYQKLIDAGYFNIVMVEVKHLNTQMSKTVVTAKGMMYILKIWNTKGRELGWH